MGLLLQGPELEVNGPSIAVAGIINGPKIAVNGAASYGVDSIICVYSGTPSGDTADRIVVTTISRNTDYSNSPSGLVQTNRVLTSSPGSQVEPNVAMTPQGHHCIVWTDIPSSGPKRVKYAIYAFNGTNVSPSSFIAAPAEFDQINPAVAIYDDSDTSTVFACVWIETQLGGPSALRAATFTYSDASPTAINVATFDITPTFPGVSNAVEPQIAVNAMSGEFFVIWKSLADENFFSNDVILAQKFDVNGTIGHSFLISDPLVNSASPKIAIRPYSGEFIATWTVGTNLFWNTFTMESTASPSPTLAQGPLTTTASENGGAFCYGDRTFQIAWIDSGRVTAQDFDKDGNPNGAAIVLNRDTGYTSTECSIVSAGHSLFSINAGIAVDTIKLNVATISDAGAEITDTKYAIGDFIVNFNSPHIYGTANPDNDAMNLMHDIYAAVTPFSNVPISPPDQNRNVTNLNTFLNSEDVILVGGPIFNKMAKDLVTTQVFKNDFNSDTELIDTTFSVLGDGHLFKAASPQMFIKNRNNPASFLTFEREQIGITINDYALIMQLRGASNRVLMVSGIRDFGTVFAMRVLDLVTQAHPGSVTNRTLALWTSILNNHKAVVIQFSIPSSNNFDTTSSILNTPGVSGATVRLFPAHGIGPIPVTPFSGDISTSTQGVLNNSILGQPVKIKDDDGLTLANSNDTSSVNFKVTAPNFVTSSGSMSFNPSVYADTVNVNTLTPLNIIGPIVATTPIVGQTPISATHLTTKNYVDTTIANTSHNILQGIDGGDLLVKMHLSQAEYDDITDGGNASGHRHADATTSIDGFMSAADKTKLDSIQTGATAFNGDVTTTSQGFLNAAGNLPVLVRDDDGLTIANSGNTQSVNMRITAPSTLTFSSTLEMNGLHADIISTFTPATDLTVTATGTNVNIPAGKKLKLGGMTTVPPGGPLSVLFVDSLQNVAEDREFLWDQTIKTLRLVNLSGGIDTPSIKIRNLAPGGVAVLDGSSNLADSVDLTWDGSTGLSVNKNLNLNNNQAKNFRVENIVTPGSGSAGRLIIDGTALKYHDGVGFKTIATTSIAFSGDVDTSTQGFLSSTSGAVLVKDDDGLDIRNSAGTQSVVLQTTGATELTATGSFVASSLKDTGLTSTRVVFAGAGGVLSDNPGLTFISGTLNTTVLACTSVSASTLKSTSLTPARVPFANGSSVLIDDIGLTYTVGSSTLTSTNIAATTGMSAPAITDSGLTFGRVTFAGFGGLLSDSASFNWDNTTGLSLGKNLDLNNNQAKNFRVENIVTPVFGNAGRLIIDAAELKYDTGSAWKTVSTFNGDLNGATLTDSAGDLSVTVAAGQDLFLTLGDNAGANGVFVSNSSATTVFSLNSSGRVNIYGELSLINNGTLSSSAADISLTPDTGRSVIVNDTLLRIGKGADDDIYIYAQNADTNKPAFRYNKTSNKWEFSNDGSSFSVVTSTFSGDTSDTSQGYFSDSNSPIEVRSLQGFKINNLIGTTGVVLKSEAANEVSILGKTYIQNNTQTNSVSLQATTATELTVGGSLVVTSDDGFTIESADATSSVKMRTLHVNTGNNLATELTFDGGAATGSNTLSLANNTTHGYTIWITARCTIGSNIGKSAMFRLELVGNGGSGTASLIGIVTETIIAREIAAWDVSATFTGNRLQLFATGETGQTIHWTAQIQEMIVG